MGKEEAQEANTRRWSLGMEDLNLNLVKAGGAEILGTFMLILFCVGSANSRTLSSLSEDAPNYFISISLAFGLGIGTIVHIIGPVSGGNVNPAVSIALLLDARISLIRAIVYIVCQFIGGFAGAGALYGLGNHQNISVAISGANAYDPDSINGAQAFFLEAFGTLFLILTILASINERREQTKTYLTPLAIGISILIMHIFLIPYTNCGINPVRGTVWNVVTGIKTDQFWVFLFGPIVGAIVAVPMFNFVFSG